MKSKSQQTTSNTFGWQQAPGWAEGDDYTKSIEDSYNTADPSIAYSFANMRKNVGNRLDNPFGPNFSPEVSDAIKYSENQNIDQMQGQAGREDSFNRKNAKVSAKMTNAALHAPTLTQTGGSMQGSQTAALGPALIGAAGAIGGGALA